MMKMLSTSQISINATIIWVLLCFQLVLAHSQSPEQHVQRTLVAKSGHDLLQQDTGKELPDVASFLQGPTKTREVATKRPHVISLRRESVPVYRQGKIASFKTSYSGTVGLGTPSQEFRVVFDTGSGNLILPTLECQSEACLVHQRYDMMASTSSISINTNGSLAQVGELCDQITIGFGTGQITGEFVRDKVCFKPKSNSIELPNNSAEMVIEPSVEQNDTVLDTDTAPQLCVDMHVVMAVEMSTQPFKSFSFDGILGLGFSSLAVTQNFSIFDMLLGGRKLGSPEFAFFLTEGDDGEESELAIGGHDSKRLLEPLAWTPVSMAHMGYWQVEIAAIRINGQTLDICKDGTCRGVVDTGTSHLGIPAPYDAEVANLATVPAGDTLDCRLALAPEIQIELSGLNITLHPFNYMRRLPLREGISVGSAQGVYLPSNETNKTLGQPSAADAVLATTAVGNASMVAVNSSNQSSAMSNSTEVRRYCRPKIVPVRLPAPLGPKFFILGEPVLHRYYTVFDWVNYRVGFGLANNRQNTRDPKEIKDRRGVLPKGVDVLLLQTKKSVNFGEKSLKLASSVNHGDAPAKAGHHDSVVAEPEEAVLVQFQVKLSVRARVRMT